MVNQLSQTEHSHITETNIAECEFFTSHSVYSQPGQYAHLFDVLPYDFVSISRVVQGLIYHYMAGQYIYGYCPPQQRMAEIDTRYTERMLGRIIEMDNHPLDQARSFENRLVGCCRDFSLLTCAVLRQHGIPARLRYGFGSYFIPDYWIDHVIVEAWNGTRWQRFDPQVTDGVDKLNLVESEYITGGRAWQMIRNEGADPTRFGLGPDMPELSGSAFIRGRLLLDIAALSKQELLCWDLWGLSDSPKSHLDADDEALLDQAANLSVQSNIAQLQALSAANPGLRVPSTVTCYSPAVGTHKVAV